MRNWANAIAHIDADCFFSSCELVRHPELLGKPVCILSSQDACVVAKTYDAKAVGIKTGMSIWEAQKLMPQATYLSADFRFYGLLSEKMFAILRRYSPDMEIYSIDEVFLDLNGCEGLWGNDYHRIAHEIRQAVQREVGITISVGISVTRILEKMASEYHKPNGVTIVPKDMIHLFLERVTLSDVCGIGKNRIIRLQEVGIYTPIEFVQTEKQIIHRLLGKTGSDLWYEMLGISVIGLELQSKLPKSMARTASMGEVTSNRKTIAAHLTRHTFRLASALITKKLMTQRIIIFLRTKEFQTITIKTDLPYPTNNYYQISHAARNMLTSLYQPKELYRACGTIAEKISTAETQQQDLFGIIKSDRKQANLIAVVNTINKKYGNESIKMAGAFSKVSRGHVRFLYPMVRAT